MVRLDIELGLSLKMKASSMSSQFSLICYVLCLRLELKEELSSVFACHQGRGSRDKRLRIIKVEAIYWLEVLVDS